jgi:biotin-dependent carboxylase-like uncharacterized protein
VSNFKVTKVLGQVTIQDNGRPGLAHLGITESGAADKWAMRCANTLVANAESEPALEITLGGFAFTTDCTVSIAVTGAKAPLLLNGRAVDQYQSIELRQGDLFEIKPATQGARVYLAVSGGIDTETPFGSASTCIRESLGTALSEGDEITLLEPTITHPASLAVDQIPQFKRSIRLGLVKGLQSHLYDWQTFDRFFTTRFEVSPVSDRMGCRLIANTTIKPPIGGIRSEGINLGTVQIPADGHPIIMLNDHQTIGGYMKIGSICRADLALLAQATPGTEVYLYPISVEQAQQRLRYQLKRVPKIV